MIASADDDFIDIELTSSSSPPNSSPQNRDFEFQMSSVSEKKDYFTTSPADHLFYKGKLLPLLQCLHLSPRLQMVQKHVNTCEEDCNSFPIFSSSSTAPSTNAYSTLAESCDISPSESCRTSCELNPTEFFFHWSTDEFRSFIHNNHKKYSWSKKLKLIIKPSSFLSLTQKLKTLRAYLKAFFIKSNESNSKEAAEPEATKLQVGKKLKRVAKKIPFGTFAHMEMKCDGWSFSGLIKRHSPSKCLSSSSDSSCSGASSLSSSFSINSNSALFDLHFFKKNRGDLSENETSIEAAIAHCKNSKKPFKM